eukprot:2679991-Rhodomonas_salina.1
MPGTTGYCYEMSGTGLGRLCYCCEMSGTSADGGRTSSTAIQRLCRRVSTRRMRGLSTPCAVGGYQTVRECLAGYRPYYWYYAKSCTKNDYVVPGTEQSCYAHATRCPVLSERMVLLPGGRVRSVASCLVLRLRYQPTHVLFTPLSAHARAMRCPVLTRRMLLPGPPRAVPTRAVSGHYAPTPSWASTGIACLDSQRGTDGAAAPMVSFARPVRTRERVLIARTALPVAFGAARTLPHLLHPLKPPSCLTHGFPAHALRATDRLASQRRCPPVLFPPYAPAMPCP